MVNERKLVKGLAVAASALDSKWGRAFTGILGVADAILEDSEDSEGRKSAVSPQVREVLRRLGIKEMPRRDCPKNWLHRFIKDPSGIHLVVGRQRAGKTALCFWLAQATAKKPIYAITLSPDVLEGVEVIDDIMEVPDNGVVVIDDAQTFFDSIRQADDDYMKLRHLSNIIEKRGVCVLFNVHSTTLLNKTPVESTKTLIFKELNYFGAEAERGFVQKYAFIAEALIKEIPITHRKEYAVFFDLPYDCFGIAKTPLPKGWNQKISTSCHHTVIDAEYNVIDEDEPNNPKKPKPEPEPNGSKKPRRNRRQEDGDEQFEG